jgi:UDP-2,3-diacylglucosamine hydrolase
MTRATTYFFSDVHLGLGQRDGERKKEDRLLHFLSSILPTTETLFIVGDLFDFWFEYRTVIPKGFHRTLAAIDQFTAQGSTVHYLVGNHDCWMGDFFTKELNVQVHTKPFETTVDGKRVLLHHGDGLALNDLGYRMIRPVLRHPFNIWLYRWLHPDLGVRLARGSSRTSRDYTSTRDYGEEDGMVQYAAARIHEGVDIVVMGHRHRALFKEIDRGIYVNLGDWITQNTYAEMHKGSITLKHWNENTEDGERQR